MTLLLFLHTRKQEARQIISEHGRDLENIGVSRYPASLVRLAWRVMSDKNADPYQCTPTDTEPEGVA